MHIHYCITCRNVTYVLMYVVENLENTDEQKNKIINSTIKGITIDSILAYNLPFFCKCAFLFHFFTKMKFYCYVLFYNLLSIFSSIS